MSDNDAKYRKLATEYAKLKAQLPVLKKAILDEQLKENALKDEIKEKDQCIRKSEQELESLIFRNDQLSKRVSVLQDDLIKSQSSKQKKSRGETGDNHGGNALLNEELQRKIRENERLHTELSQIKQETDNQIMLLGDKIDSLEFSEKKHNQKMDKVSEEQKSQLDKLREEKALLEVRVETQERTVREAKLSASLAGDSLQRIEKEMTSELSQAKKIIQTKIPFNDTKWDTLNAVNVPTHNRRYQIQVREHLRQINSYIRDFSEHMSGVFSYLDQRYKVYPSSSSSSRTIISINSKLCSHLKEAPSILRCVTEEFRKFSENQPEEVVLTLDTAVNLGRFSSEFSRFNNYIKKILSYLTISLAEESLLSLSTQAISDQNVKTTTALKQFSNSVDKTSSYLQLLASQSSRDSDHPKGNQVKMLNLLSTSLSQLYHTTKGLGVAYSMKSQLETQLPTAPETLTSTDQCLLKSLVSTSTSLSKLSTFVTEHYESSSDQYLPLLLSTGEKHDPVVTQLQSQSADYMKLIQQPVPPTVPYEVALENMKTLFSSTESRESLHEQVTKLNSKASKLEQEKEHWMLEAQLLKIKYDKLQKSQTQNGPSVISPKSESSSSGTVALRDSNSSMESSSLDAGEFGSVTKRHSSSEEETRESLLKAHLNKRIEELTLSLQQADSRSVAYHAECRALGRRLQISNKARTKATEELNEANSTISHLQDELVTTKKSYDAQLMTMSEALASMNGNLASQQDEIEELKAQIRSSRRGKK